jgi:hypothetical protein
VDVSQIDLFTTAVFDLHPSESFRRINDQIVFSGFGYRDGYVKPQPSKGCDGLRGRYVTFSLSNSHGK